MASWKAGIRSGWLAGLMLSLLLLAILPHASLASNAPPNPLPAFGTMQPLAGVPLEVFSREENGLLVAEIRGRLDYPLAQLESALDNPVSWCDFLPLVFNVKSCIVRKQDGLDILTLYIGGKSFQTPQEAMRLDYVFRVVNRDQDRFRILLTALHGPWGTSDYQIELLAVAAESGRTNIRLHSSFKPSLRSTIATTAYLATAGRGKVGFSVDANTNEGPVYVGGIQGVIERNVMRYYLALQAYLDTLQLPEERRFESRLDTWFRSTENYHRQLYEMDKQEYLDVKRRERRHQLQLQQRLG